MQVAELKTLAVFRAVVGYLGEKDRHGWWQSSFFAAGSKAFLAPVFPRTQLLAQFNGVTQAAGLKHDERIGVGNVYHLFRLPEDIEQGLYRVLHESVVGESVIQCLTSIEDAVASLKQFAGDQKGSGVGPVRIGGTLDLRSNQHWRPAAATYLHAFDHGTQSFPFFSDRA